VTGSIDPRALQVAQAIAARWGWSGTRTRGVPVMVATSRLTKVKRG